MFISFIINGQTYTYRIKSVYSNKYLNLENNNREIQCTSIKPDWASAIWYLMVYKGFWIIKNYHTGYYLFLNEKQQLECKLEFPNDRGVWSTPMIEKGSNDMQIQSVYNKNLYINIENKEQNLQCTEIKNDWVSARWIFEPVTLESPYLPIKGKKVDCSGNMTINFNNMTSQSLCFYYWYAEDIPIGHTYIECDVMKFWKVLTPGKNEFTMPKNKSLIYRVYKIKDNSCNCSFDYLKEEGSIYTHNCNVNYDVKNIY